MIHPLYPLCPLLLLLCANAEQTRFRRIITQYDNHYYFTERRDIRLDIAREVNPGLRSVDTETLDTTYRFQKAVAADVAFSLVHRAGSVETETENRTAAAIAIHHGTSGYSMRGYRRPGGDTVCFGPGPDDCLVLPYGQALSDSDTVITSFSLTAGHHRTVTGYIGAPERLSPFLHLDAGVDVQGRYEDEENVEPLLPDSIIQHKYYQGKRSLAVAAVVEAQAGTGKLQNVSHIYYAFELEREMLKRGVISFPLSDETLAALARLLARHDSYTLRDHNTFRQFKAKLDSIILRDSAVQPDKLRYLSQFQLRKVMLRGGPTFYRGPRIALAVPLSLTTTLIRHAKHYPFDRLDRYIDTLRSDIELRHNSALELRFSWGIALTSRWFVDCACTKRVLSRDEGVGFIDTNGVDLEKLFETQLHLCSSYWVGGRLLVQLGTDYLPAYVAVPKDWPTHSYLAGRFVIEDYIAVAARFSLHNGSLPDSPAHPFSNHIMRRGFMASAAVIYGF